MAIRTYTAPSPDQRGVSYWYVVIDDDAWQDDLVLLFVRYPKWYILRRTYGPTSALTCHDVATESEVRMHARRVQMPYWLYHRVRETLAAAARHGGRLPGAGLRATRCW